MTISRAKLDFHVDVDVYVGVYVDVYVYVDVNIYVDVDDNVDVGHHVHLHFGHDVQLHVGHHNVVSMLCEGSETLTEWKSENYYIVNCASKSGVQKTPRRFINNLS